jgi:hypothetical protein
VTDSEHEGARVTLSTPRRVVVLVVGILFALAATGVVAKYLAEGLAGNIDLARHPMLPPGSLTTST